MRQLGWLGGAAVLVGCLVSAPEAWAQDAIGDYGYVSGSDPVSAGVTPPDGAQQVLLTTENSAPTHDGGTVFADPINTDGSTGAVPTATLASFIGADPAVINYNANNPGTEGSADFIEVDATGATVLSLDYDFVTSELVGAANLHPDFAFLTSAQLVDGMEVAPASFSLLASAADTANAFKTIADPNGLSPFDVQEGYKSLSISIATAGTYIFGLGVADADTFDTQSGLFLDDVTVTAVPEPGAVKMLLLASAGAAIWFLRRGRNMANRREA